MAKQSALQKLIEENKSAIEEIKKIQSGVIKQKYDQLNALPKNQQAKSLKELLDVYNKLKKTTQAAKPTIPSKEPVSEQPKKETKASKKTKEPKVKVKPADIIPEAEAPKAPVQPAPAPVKPASTLESKAIAKGVEEPSRLKKIISDEVSFKPKPSTLQLEGGVPLRGAAKEFSEELIKESPDILTSLKPTEIAKATAKAGLGKTASVLGGKVLPAAGFAYDAYDVGKSIDEGDYSSAARKGLGGLGSFLGGLGGGALGSVAGPVGTVGGAVGGSMIGQTAGEGLYDVAKSAYDKYDLSTDPIKPRSSPRPGGMDYYDESPTSYPEYKPVSSSDLKLPKPPEFIPYQESDRPKSLAPTPSTQNYDKELEEFIGMVESGGDYTAVNPSSGARGKYQFMKKDHEEEIKKRYGMSFEEAMDEPEIQDKYFRDVWLPQNKKLAAELAQTPEAKSKLLDEFTLTALLQLGQGNVKQYLAGTLPENKKANIENQINYFRSKADQYKKNMSQEELDKMALDEKTKQMQESGTYLPFKSAQAKMDTLREGSGGFVKPSEETPVSSFASKEAPPAEEITKPESTPRSRLEEALLLQQQYEKMAQISRGAERIGRGLIGAFSKTGPAKMSGGEFEESLSRMGKQGVEGAKLLQAADTEREEADPTSARSKRAREQANAMFESLGMDVNIPETTAAKDLKQYTDLAKYSTKQQATDSKITTKRLDKLGNDLIAELKNRQQFGADARAMANVQNAEALLTGYKSLDDVPEIQVYEVARAIDRVVSQASPTITSSAKLTPETARSIASKYISKITGDPKGAGVGQFLENFQKVLKTEKGLAAARIKEVQNKIAAPYIDLWQDPQNRQKIRFIFKSNGLDADSVFENFDLDENDSSPELTSQESPSKPTVYKNTNIRVHD